MMRTAVQHGRQVAALDEPHIHKQSPVDLAVEVDRDDVRVVQSRRRMVFAAEALLKHLVMGKVGGQQLERDNPIDGRVVGPPHLAHPATAQ